VTLPSFSTDLTIAFSMHALALETCVNKEETWSHMPPETRSS